MSETKVEETQKKPLSLSVEEALQACPELKEMVTSYRAEQEEKKTGLVTRLVAAQSEYVEDDLKKMNVIDLERMERMLGKKAEEGQEKKTPGKVDFSVKGSANPSKEVKVNENWRKLPDPWNLNVAKQ